MRNNWSENPARGWYQIYTIELKDQEEPIYIHQEDTLALLLINLSHYNKEPLSEAALAMLEHVLEAFSCAEKQMIIRFTYDIAGQCILTEPESITIIEAHMQQAIPYLLKRKQQIYVCQGLFFGNWGEMHGGRYGTLEDYRRLTDCWKTHTAGQLPLAFRTPKQAKYVSQELQVGLFDDAILADPSHLGTFENLSQEEEWIHKVTQNVPCGGEMLYPAEGMSADHILQELRTMEVSYLNRCHDYVFLEELKQIPYGETSLYDYIGDHLGYCFSVKKSKIKGIFRKKLYLTLKNEGFGRLYQEGEGELVYEYRDRREALLLEPQLQLLLPGQEKTYQVTVPRRGRIELLLRTKEQKKNIRPLESSREQMAYLIRNI